MKRLLSILMVLVLVFSIMPHPAFASEATQEGTDTGTSVVIETPATEESLPEESTEASEAPVEENSEEEAPVEENSEEEAPVEENSEEEAPAEENSEEEAPAEENSEEEAPAEENSEEEAPAEENSEEEAPAEENSEEEAPAEENTEEDAPAEENSEEEAPVEEVGEDSDVMEFPVMGLDDGAATITVSSSSYRNKYVVISDGTNSDLYYISNQGRVQNTDGTDASFVPGTYTIYYGINSAGGRGGAQSSFASGTVTVDDSDTNVSVRLSTARVSNTNANVYKYATSSFYNTTSFDHVDVRVAGSYVIHVGSQTYSATVSNPTVVVKVGGTQVARQSWSNDGETYEWRQTGLSLTKASVISIELTLDLTYTDANGDTHIMENVQIVYDSVNNVDKFIDAIAICDMVQGLDFRVTVEDIEEEIVYHTVSYEWRVYNTDGTYTSLPAGAPGEPASSSGYASGDLYSYDTSYVSGSSFYDYDNGLLYTFHGWDTHSHSSVYNPHPGTGYHSLDGTDTIEVTNDTYIYGYWTVTELEPSSAHIAIEKVIMVDGVEMPLADAEDLWFRIQTGIDKDGDGDSEVDVDYPMILASNGEYKIPVYQYDTPFVFTEYNADVPGYTRTTTISVSGSYITGSSQNGDSVTVSMQPVYQGENIHLGTVTYVNSYTKNVGAPVHVYPTLTLLKSAADTRMAQEGVVFTLYADAACSDVVTTITTGSGGLVNVDFGAIDGIAPGTYYLAETQALAGYHADPYVYAITLAAEKTVEELRSGNYVQVTYYSLSIALPTGSTAAHEAGSNRLHIFDAPILGSLSLNKTIAGMADADKAKVNAVVIVHGPISRDGSGNITDIGNTWQLDLDSENNWTASLEALPLGEYLIHESFASVHGYTWTGVTYGTLPTTVYNGITSGILTVENENAIQLTLENTYEEWTSADFYIKKVDDNGAALAGAVFSLYSDEAGANLIATQTTGADGYAHFTGFTVPDGQTSVTYYLRETKAPAGYYLSDQVYRVVISVVTNPETGKTTYEPQISLVTGRSNGFDIAHDLLTVTNFPVLGELTVTKAFANGLIPEALTKISVQVSGPNGYNRILELNSQNNWSVTLEGLVLGTYTITELNANVAGYTWEVSYDSTTVTLAEATPGLTVPGAEISGNATITNSYTRNEEIYEVPTSLTVKKVGENGEALAGAVFTLSRMGADGKTVIESQSFTTGTDGTVVFDLLSGFIQSGEAINGTYILAEIKAPAGYEPTGSTWTVTIRENDGQIRWTLNENKNLFEGFWDWIVGNVSAGSFANGVLTVQNVRSRGNLTIRKQVEDAEGLYAGAEYSFTLDCSDDSFDRTFTLKAGESITIENIPWGTTYTLTEDTTGAAFTSAITDGGNGRIWAAETEVVVTNTYTYTTHNQPLSLIKVDADDTTKVIAGAGFTLYADAAMTTQVGVEVFSDENGRLSLPIPAAGTYYLAETTTPDGYHANSKVYIVTAQEQTVVLNSGTADAVTQKQLHIRITGLTGTTTNQIDYTYSITNTAIKSLVVNVEKIWDDSNYYGRPESVEVTLYRNNVPFDTVTLNADNNWRYSWKDLTDEYNWSVDEPTVPQDYTKSVTNQGNDWTITNTRVPNPVSITVLKSWIHNGGKDLPASINVTLYRNGEVYETVTLNADNSWTHTWEGLNDASRWSVDENDVPAGYTKEISVDGYAFYITNTRTINPVEVSVTKVWEGSEGVIHPESVEVSLYRNGEVFDTVTLNEENGWTHTWSGLTDEYTWNVDEPNVPQGYSKNITNQGYNFTITNTKEFTYIDISVQKLWYGTGVEHPTSVNITLYRNGEVFDTVTLSAANNWTYTWEDLTDEFEWTVDEPSVPRGYYKSIQVDGYNFTIMNVHEDVPQTGDFTNLFGMGAMAAIGSIGSGVSGLALLKSLKKKEEDEEE